MKGLLYKDISIMTRSFKGNILLLVALYGVLILVTREAYLAYAMTVVWGIYVASTINYDEQAHWDAYAATLPVTPGQVIASKYLLCAASTAIGAALSLALVLLAGVGGAEYALGILACAEVSVLMNALLMPITYRFGAAKSRAYLMVIVFAIVFGACFAAFCAADAPVIPPVRCGDRVGKQAGDNKILIGVEIVRREKAAAERVAQQVGERLHTEAVVVADEPP